MAIVALTAFAVSAGTVVSIPDVGFSGAKAVRGKIGVNVTSAGGKQILCVRPSPTGNAKTAEAIKVEVESACVTVDSTEAFEAGAQQVIIEMALEWPCDELSGQDCLAVSDLSGEGASVRFCACGSRVDKDAQPFVYRKGLSKLGGRRRTYNCPMFVPGDIKSMVLRYVIDSPGKEPVRWYGVKMGLRDDLELKREPFGEPELLFHAGFDTPDATAKFSKGPASPLKMEGVEFVNGGGRCGGSAMQFGGGKKSVISYSANGNVRPYCGTVAFWAQLPSLAAGSKGRCTAFSLASKDGRKGAGDVSVGWQGGDNPEIIRGDLAKSRVSPMPQSWHHPDKGWHHWVFVWSDMPRLPQYSMFCDGRPVPRGRGLDLWIKSRPTSYLSAVDNPMEFDRRDGDFETFSIGSADGTSQFEGLIDDIKIFSAPLDVFDVRKLFDAEREVVVKLGTTYLTEGEEREVTVSARFADGKAPANVEYAVWNENGREVAKSSKPSLTLRLAAGEYSVGVLGHDSDPLSRAPLWVLKKGNPWVLPPQSNAGVPGRRRLVAEWKAGDVTLEEMEREKRFRAVGKCTFGELEGRKYLETGSRNDDRFALRFGLNSTNALYCIEFDYPDDKVRTAEIIVEPAKDAMLHNRYEMQCGYACGSEFALTGRMLTHRVLYWPVASDIVAIVRSLHGQPAAIAAVRIYELEEHGVPAAKMPDAAGKTPRRSFAGYSEDVALLNYCFGLDQASAKSFDGILERLSAAMKYCGQDTLVYPGVWYLGVIEGIDGIYNPREHAKDFVQGIFEKFDHEGLSFFPLVNRMGVGYPRSQMTRNRLRDGSFHDSPISIFDNGLPNRSAELHVPNDYNIQHPLVQKAYMDDIERMIEYGRGHKSFKGVCIHLTQYSAGCYGGLASGYNDYSVEAFSKATGIKVPGDRSDPMRGKAYADWIKANCLERWIDWRCDVLADFYARLAERLRRADPNLKLWINVWPSYRASFPGRADIVEDCVTSRILREYGIDGAKLHTRIPNLILGTMDVPMFGRDEWPNMDGTGEEKLRVRDIALTAGFYSESVKGGFPAVTHFDSYFESAAGRASGAKSLTCDWMQDHPWRCSAINPSGRNVLRDYAVPLKFTDVMIFSKGGFLYGHYGAEEALAPWMQNFRALPAVMFGDVESPSPDVTIRQGSADGMEYLYIVNTTPTGQRVRVAALAGYREIVNGHAASCDVALAPYELKSYIRQSSHR